MGCHERLSRHQLVASNALFRVNLSQIHQIIINEVNLESVLSGAMSPQTAVGEPFSVLDEINVYFAEQFGANV
jgi:hypothetical protein